jgi:hypothetical protein
MAIRRPSPVFVGAPTGLGERAAEEVADEVAESYSKPPVARMTASAWMKW